MHSSPAFCKSAGETFYILHILTETENALLLGRHESHSFTQRFAFAYMSVHVVQQAVLPAVPALFETDNVLPCVQYNAAVKQETVHRHQDNQI